MSAFAVVYSPSGSPVDPGALARPMERLAHRGPDGQDALILGNLAMGHCHFWTTPEDVGGKQPLRLEPFPFTLVLDGRLDNRDELFHSLGIDHDRWAGMSDAALLLHAYGSWAEGCLEHLLGDFAFVLHDPVEERLFCARDPLGERTLFHACQGGRMVIASEPWAVAGAFSSPPRLDESAVAHYFAMRATADGQTFFEGIRELLPAHAMQVTADGRDRTWMYWQPDLERQRRGLSEAGYAAEFLDLLQKSLRCRLRSREPLGILMSGGLDSTSLACLAAGMLPPGDLTAYSNVYNELPDCDERKYMDMVTAKYGLHSVQIPCDDAWPFQDQLHHQGDPGEPEPNLYPDMWRRAFARVRQDGRHVLLSGAFGDHLYGAAGWWWSDLLADGGLRRGTQEVRYLVDHIGLRRTLQMGLMRAALVPTLRRIPGAGWIRSRRDIPPWLTKHAAGLVRRGAWQPKAARSNRSANLLSLETARDSTDIIPMASRSSLEIRYPYRDRRLVDYALQLPAYQFYFRGRNKVILRSAMAGILPEELRTRSQLTSLLSLYQRGIEREQARLEGFICGEWGAWQRYVRQDWLAANWKRSLTLQNDGPQALVLNKCLAYERWKST